MRQPHRDHRPLRVVVAGGGVAGLEAIVALRALAGERAVITLVDPGETFAIRALEVGEPFGQGTVRRYPLAELAEELDATLVRDSVHRVQRETHDVLLRSGESLGYDALIVALGAFAHPAYDHGVMFDTAQDPRAIDAVIDRLAAAAGAAVAVVVPPGVGWTLPAYELALMFAAVTQARVTLVTPERQPLEAFGPAAADLAREELQADRVTLLPGTEAAPVSDTRLLLGDGRSIDVDAIVHLPLHAGPHTPGLPCDDDGFIVTGAHGRIGDEPDVYAAGDATTGPIKQGGLAAQQAQEVAVEVARRAGVAIAPPPHVPVLRGVLRTPRGARYLRAEPPGGRHGSWVSRHSLWWPPSKIASTWLVPWLERHDPDRVRVAAEPQAGARPEPPEPRHAGAAFERALARGDAGSGARAVVFEPEAADGSGWRLVEHDGDRGARRASRPLALEAALAMLDPEDRDRALAAHVAALAAAGAELAGMSGDQRTPQDIRRLERLAALGRRVDVLARELAAA